MDSWKLYVMGCRGSWPVCGEEFSEFGGATSCYVLKKDTHAVVVDCGTGLYRAEELLSDCTVVDVLLTHVHYDHLIGVLDWTVFPSKAKLNFYGGFSGWFGEETLAHFMSPPFWPYTPLFQNLVNVEAPGEVRLGDELLVHFWPSNHPDGAYILRIDSKEGDICIAFDYEHSAPFPRHMAKDCALLIYDAMFTREEYQLHEGWGHSCWEEGCRLAQNCGVQRLLITHHAPQRTDEQLRELEMQAQQCFLNTRFARMGDIIRLN